MRCSSKVIPKTVICAFCALLVGLAAGIATDARQKDPPKETELTGKWIIISTVEGGVELKDRAGTKIMIEGERFRVAGEDGNPDKLKFRIDATKKPKHIDFIEPNVKENLKGIYSIEGDTLKICYDRAGKSRPTEFTSKKDSEISLTILKRDKK